MFIQTYQSLPQNFYQTVFPEPMASARLVAFNSALATSLDLALEQDELLAWLAGEKLHPKMAPLAQKYTGHQFGYYNPDLGDGRGLLLGQWQDKQNRAWDFHLKGAGRTPFSRRGDGRAVLRSSIREFLGSEALYGLGVPTTRALALATGPEPVRRETLEPRATLLRVSLSHIRFGHFEWAASQGKSALQALMDYVLAQHYPELLTEENPTSALFKEVCFRTARLIAKWQAVGFNHGVMNTDNMSILGETFDFGPYAFFDDFQIGYVCNHSDTEARYAYNEQPRIGLWNCQVLAGAFSLLLDEVVLDEGLSGYVLEYNRAYLAEMTAKLGLQQVQADDKLLVADLLVALDQQRTDFSLFFRRLAFWQTAKENELWTLFSQPKLMTDWFQRFERRLTDESVEFPVWQARILATNPAVYLRNYIAQEVIEAVEAGKDEVLMQWVNRLHRPFLDYPELENYQKPPGLVKKNLVLSCSS